jgi:hypothetical protein
MATQRYSATPQPVHPRLTWVKSGEVATPVIQLRQQVSGGSKRYGGITESVALRANLEQNGVPTSLWEGEPIGSYTIGYNAVLVEVL